MMFPFNKNSNQGFSLTEALVAMVILGIIATGSMAFYYRSNEMYYRGLHNQTAMMVADSRMEQIKNAGCAGASNLAGMATDKAAGTAVSLTAGTGLTGLRKVTLPACGASNNDVVVNVVWTEAGETPNSNLHSVKLETYVGA